MRTEYGNIWRRYDQGYYIVIPTNIGWKADGTNPMGTGLAKDAAQKFADLPEIYGEHCRLVADGAELSACLVVYEYRLILAPTKKLDRVQPWRSWAAPADVETVKQSIRDLNKLLSTQHARDEIGAVFVPLLGAGAGSLPQSQSLYYLSRLKDWFVVVLPEDENGRPFTR